MNIIPLPEENRLPEDWRPWIRLCNSGAHHNGPLRSGPGVHPEVGKSRPFQWHAPNFEGLYADNHPCHPGPDHMREMVTRLEGTPEDYMVHRFNNNSILQDFGGRQPLTTNVRNRAEAEGLRNDIEAEYQDAAIWVKLWYSWLHYDSLNPARVKKLAYLHRILKIWYRMQERDEIGPSKVNGFVSMTDPLRIWMWPWKFYYDWYIRQVLLHKATQNDPEYRISDDPTAPKLDYSISVLNSLSELDWHLQEEIIFSLMPEVRGIPALSAPATMTNLDHESRKSLRQLIFNVQEVANLFFKTRALRFWDLGFPWRKIWVVMDEEDEREAKEAKVKEIQELLHADVHASRLMTVHPILLSQLPDYAEFCPISQCGGDNYKNGDLLLETVCHHFACVPCTLMYWKNHQGKNGRPPRNFGDWPCPSCRTSASRLRDKINIIHTQGLGDRYDGLLDQINFVHPML